MLWKKAIITPNKNQVIPHAMVFCKILLGTKMLRCHQQVKSTPLAVLTLQVNDVINSMEQA